MNLFDFPEYVKNCGQNIVVVYSIGVAIYGLDAPIEPASTQPKEAWNATGDPCGPDHQLVCSAKRNTFTLRRRSILLGVLKQGSASWSPAR